MSEVRILNIAGDTFIALGVIMIFIPLWGTWCIRIRKIRNQITEECEKCGRSYNSNDEEECNSCPPWASMINQITYTAPCGCKKTVVQMRSGVPQVLIGEKEKIRTYCDSHSTGRIDAWEVKS